MNEVAVIHFHSQEIWLHGGKLLWLPECKLLCIADIHFEKASFFSRFGALLPPYDTDETLQNLTGYIERFQPEIFIALGDSFHDKAAAERLTPENRAHLTSLVNQVKRWIWITGNHDPAIDATIPGIRQNEFIHEHIIFTHEIDGRCDTPQIGGHFHPKTRFRLQERIISAPCFLANANKLILPSFGAFTGGLDIDSPELKQLIPQGSRQAYITYRQNIFLKK